MLRRCRAAAQTQYHINMNCAYIRVSTDKQTVENQRFEIIRFCKQEKIRIDRWVEETVSGAKEPGKRKLGPVLRGLKEGDILIAAELSRLGRSLFMVMGILNECACRGIQVWTVKGGFRLGADIPSKVLAFAFALAAEIERGLAAQRTKEALAMRRAKGVILGRPKGRANKTHKLSGRGEEIQSLLAQCWTVPRIARRMKVHRATIYRLLAKPEIR